MTGGWAAANTLRGIVLTVEECDERIAAAQHVLDNPGEYPVEVRVDADKAVRRYTKLRDGAAALALVQTALEAAEHRVEYSHNDTCDSVLSESEDYPCTCGHDALDAALRAVREGK